jgi:thymidine phosphorylase
VFVDVRLGDEVVVGQPLLTVHAEAAGDADYAFDYALASPSMIEIE